LLRHAEATPAQGWQQDVERPLSLRGRADAQAATVRIAASGLAVDRILVSPALRARDTGAIVAAGLNAVERLHVVPLLYPGTAESLWTALQQLPSAVQCVLLIGHNPALSALARQCGAAPDSELPTAALYLAGLPDSMDWSALTPDRAYAIAFPA